MAYVRSKTIKGKTYQYLVKSVREGKRVRQVFVSYIGNPPPASSQGGDQASQGDPHPHLLRFPDFTPLIGSDVRVPYVTLLRQLGCPSVAFSLRANHKHGDVIAQRHKETGKFHIVKVRLRRDASVHAMAHEVGHVLDYVLQNAYGLSGSLDAHFTEHTETLRKLANYTRAHHERSSPDYVRRLKGLPESKDRNRSVRRLNRYYERYVYKTDELFARLVAVSFTEPEKAKAIAPAAYGWLQAAFYGHERIRTALTEVGLWPKSR